MVLGLIVFYVQLILGELLVKHHECLVTKWLMFCRQRPSPAAMCGVSGWWHGGRQ